MSKLGSILNDLYVFVVIMLISLFILCIAALLMPVIVLVLIIVIFGVVAGFINIENKEKTK